MSESVKSISTDELDSLFDEGEEDVLQYFDTEKVLRPNLETQRVNVDFPKWMVQQLDTEARRLSIPRQAVIKTWIDERLQALRGTSGR